jgi:hypothetical protein
MVNDSFDPFDPFDPFSDVRRGKNTSALALEVVWLLENAPPRESQEIAEPIYPDDPPASLQKGDMVRCPRTKRSFTLTDEREYTYFELRVMFDGAEEA